jgi:hypothetical protein
MITLVKYDYDSMPEKWKEQNKNPYQRQVFALLGEIQGMPGHSYVQDVYTGKSYILHTDNLTPLTEEEL